MAIPSQRTGEVDHFVFSRVPALRTVDDAIKQDLAVAFDCLGSRELAALAVERTWERLETAIEAQAENRRSSYTAKEKRGPYKPLTHDEFVRRGLLLDSIRRFQMRNETSKRIFDPEYNIQCLCLELGLLVMHHNAFYAAVAMTRVIADYPASATLNVYYSSAPDDTLNAGKDASSVSRVENAFAEALLERFGRRIKLKAGSSRRFQRVKPNEAQIDALRYWLLRFLPRIPDTSLGFPPTNTQGSHEGALQMKPIESILDMELFNAIADDVGISHLENCLELPLIADEDPGGHLPGDDPRETGQRPHSAPGALASDVSRIKRSILKARQKRESIQPQALAVYVDDVFQGILSEALDMCALQLKESSRIITLVARDTAGAAVTLATYALIHDRPKEETWRISISGLGEVVCGLKYMDEGVVEALFVLTEQLPFFGRQLSQYSGEELLLHPLAVVKHEYGEERRSREDDSSRPAGRSLSKKKAEIPCHPPEGQFPRQLPMPFPDKDRAAGDRTLETNKFLAIVRTGRTPYPNAVLVKPWKGWAIASQ